MTASRDERPVLVLVTESEAATRRMKDALGDQGDLVVSDSASLERIVQIVDSVRAVLVIIHVDEQNDAAALALIEELHTVKPLLPVLALTDALEQNLVLAAMRAGACDLFTMGYSREEVRERLQHVLRRSVQYATRRERSPGKIFALVSARPDADCAILALHVALALRRLAPASNVLLLDLGVPEADSLLFLGLRASYSFVDAVRSTRRFDETLIETAFARHASGLALLAMPEEATSTDITANDVIVLLNILRGYYPYIVANLGGMPQSQFLQLTVANADQVFLLCEQSVPSCRGNKKLMDYFQSSEVGKNAELIVDRYLDKMEPSAQEIAERLGIPLKMTLPPSGLCRLNMKNSGQTLFEFAPKDRYAQAIEQLARSLVQESATPERRSRLSVVKRWLQH